MSGLKAKFKKKFGKKSNVSEDTLSEFMQSEMQHARLGVLYIFSKTNVDGKFASLFLKGVLDSTGSSLKGVGKLGGDGGLALAGSITGATKVPLDEAVKYFTKDGGAKSNIASTPEEKEVATSLWGKLTAFLSDMFKKLLKKLSEDVFSDMSKWGAAIKAIIKGVVGQIVAAAVPLTGIFDVASGVTKACVAGFQRVSSWLETRSTSMIQGYPTVIVAAIHKAMNRSIGEGLYTAVKGGIQIGADVAAAGAGSLVKAIATGIELIVQLVQRIVEIGIFTTFSNEAKQHWTGRETSGFTRDAETFAAWMKKYALKVPAIGALAINCGYCGSPMQYLNMFNGDKSLVSQKDFDAGVSMLARLKMFGANYLNDIGLGFSSDDPVVNGALKAAKSYGQKNHIKQNGVGDVLYGVLTG